MPSLLRRLFRILLLLVIASFVAVATGQNLSSTADLFALYSLRSSLGLRARDWPRGADPCTSWVGVGCDADGRVVSLDLHGLRRTRLGKLNPRFAVEGIQNISRLYSFNATGFALPGPIPDWFGSLLPPSFSVLDLRGAFVSGDIPYSLGGASSITVLSLAQNYITGDIPPTLGQLGNLSILDLSRNMLSGDLPPSLASLGNLTYIDLSSNFLTGAIPSKIGALLNLRTLVLANNSLTGSMPPQLGNLSSLATLDLSINSLFGDLPDRLSNLRSLQSLNLGSNFLTGYPTSTLFSGLSELGSITLSRNNFSGELPDYLWSSRKIRFLDVSYNNFSGTLPELSLTNVNANGSSFNLSHNLFYGSISSEFAAVLSTFNYVDISDNYLFGSIPPNSSSMIIFVQNNCFNNTLNQRSQVECKEFYNERGIPFGVPLNQILPSKSSKSKNTWKYIVIAVVAGSAILVFMVVILMLCLRWNRSHSPEQQEVSANATSDSPEGVTVPPPAVAPKVLAPGEAFTIEQLAPATNGFDEGNLIKHGHSGDFYSGVLENGIHVVVKRMDMSNTKKEACQVELDFFARFSHERLVTFVGHCLESENKNFLVYRQMLHRDLGNALFRKPAVEDDGLQSLDWITRLKIATGVAEALFYLHHECVPPLVHRDIQASSILLDDKFEVRLGSLSSICAQEGDAHHNVISRYLKFSHSTEPPNSGKPPASCAYDVYCFGKVLLELVTGRLGISGTSDGSTSEWLEHTLRLISIHEKDLVTQIVDPSLVVDEDLLEEVWAMAIVARSCLNPKPSKRPLTKYILKALENPLKVVRDDNNVGSARLKATSSRSSWNAAFFGSWRHGSSDHPSASATAPRDDRSLRSQGSGGEHSFSHRKPFKEIFPEPHAREMED